MIFSLNGGRHTYTKKNDTMKTVAMACLAVSWAITRIFIFPYYIIHSSLMDLPNYVPVDLVFPLWGPLEVLLVVLYAMHVYWFYLILRIIYNKLIRKKEMEDDRDDVETEAKPNAETIRKKHD